MTQTTQARVMPRLTKKQAGFVDDFVATGNGTQSALKHYEIESKYPEKVASVIAAENLAKPSVALAVDIKQETLKSALQKQGVTPAKIAKKIDGLLDSDDPNAVDKGIRHATNIYGVEDLDKPQTNNTTYNFLFNVETQREIKEIEAKIKERLINVPKIETANSFEQERSTGGGDVVGGENPSIA